MTTTPIKPGHDISIDNFISEKIIEQIDDEWNKLWCYICRGGLFFSIPGIPSGVCAFMTEEDAIEHCRVNGSELIKTEQRTLVALKELAVRLRLSSVIVLTPTNGIIEVINVNE